MNLTPLQKFQNSQCLDPDNDFGPLTIKAMRFAFSLSIEQTANFAGQCAHESNYFKRQFENLNYSYERLLQIFSHDFDTDRNRILSDEEKQVARILERKPQQIANFVYANQNGNGDEASGDGWLFRGRGPLQLTGRRNYQLFAAAMNDQEIMCNPDLVVTKYYFESALWYFESNNLWSIAKKTNRVAIKNLTKRVNGGYHGLQDRINKTINFEGWLRAA
ncbi:glycoside hydrolase family 19 protein [Zunongwangia endophytica]|uniref:Glycoside hydrolase family 19 protein n=1 Tax=Zunongwangia endophytica TaxID=1808945 RepID=A0ABV8H898_9FLAO|nr:glycoside hydrolase family 19 protein [Zunongwangia endophytica]MDN3595328.1 glycoside hydrolase family 19 protein [Zunongwangia endophytica]